MYFPDSGCVRPFRNLYGYATAGSADRHGTYITAVENFANVAYLPGTITQFDVVVVCKDSKLRTAGEARYLHGIRGVK